MKKKYLFLIIIPVIIVCCIIILKNMGNTLLLDSISFTVVERGSFRQEYHSYATVKGDLHYFYFNGIIDNCSHSEGDYIEADSVILEYLNREGEKTELKSDTAGFISEINTGRVTVTDRNYHLVARIPLDKYHLIADGTVCLFSRGTESIKATVNGKKLYRINDNGRTYGIITLTLDNSEGLLLQQQGSLIIPLNTISDVLTVEREALWEKSDGYYLLKADWLNSKDDISHYLVKVKVMMSDDEVAVVTGLDIENLKVCIIDETLKGLLDD